MAITILTDATITLGGTDISAWVESVEINQTYEDVEITAMGATARTYAPGLREDEITLNLHQDFDVDAVDQTIYPLLGSQAGAAMVIKPTSGTVSSVNPSYTCTVAVYEYSPLAGSVGDVSDTSVTFKPVAGSSIVRAVS